MAIRIAPAFAVHPGEWLRIEIVEPNGLSVTDTAKHLGVTRQAMSALLNGRGRPLWRHGDPLREGIRLEGGYVAQDAGEL